MAERSPEQGGAPGPTAPSDAAPYEPPPDRASGSGFDTKGLPDYTPPPPRIEGTGFITEGETTDWPPEDD